MHAVVPSEDDFDRREESIASVAPSWSTRTKPHVRVRSCGRGSALAGLDSPVLLPLYSNPPVSSGIPSLVPHHATLPPHSSYSSQPLLRPHLLCCTIAGSTYSDVRPL